MTHSITSPTRLNPDDQFAAIRNRRSAKRVLGTQIPRPVIERLLEAATWAPNHHLTQPWRFWVISGSGRERFGEAMAASDLNTHTDATDVQREAMRQSAIMKARRAPVIIAVAAVVAEDAKNPAVEEVAATAAGIQNLLLQVEAERLGAIWRTGRSAYEPEMKQFFGLTERDYLLGFVYLGYPDPATPPHDSQRTPAGSLTVWVED